MAGTGSVLVPKGPRAQSFDKEKMLEALFAMPLPASPTRTRTYPVDTVLGRIMRLRGLTVNEVAKVPRGPSARQIGDHLAGRRNLNPQHLATLARELGIDARLLH